MITTDELRQDFGIEATLMILACRVFSGTATPAEVEAFLKVNKPDWQHFYKLICMHQVRPVIYRALYKCGIPEEIKQRLQADCMRIALHNLEHAKEMTKLYGLLLNAGITAIPYKGSIFCLEYYKDIGLREFSDIDFLINLDINDIATIKGIFENLGYIDKSDVPDDFKETHFKYTREYYFDLYEQEHRKFHAEFHWSTASPEFDFPTPMPNSLLFQNLTESDFLGNKVRILNPTYHFIAMVTHHGLNQRWSVMKYIMDSAMIIKNGKGFDWNEITAISKRFGFNKAVNTGLYITDNLLGIQPGITYTSPKDSRHYLNDLLSSSNKRRKSATGALLVNLKIKDNFADRLKMVYKYIRHATIPSILDYQFLKLPKGLFFLYTFIKPIRMATNVIKKGL